MTAPSGPDNIDVTVRLTDDLSAPAKLVIQALNDIRDAARNARIELNMLQTSLRRTAQNMARLQRQADRLSASLAAQAAAVNQLADEYRRLNMQMQMHLNQINQHNAATNRSARTSRKFGNVLTRMRKVAMLTTKGIALLTAGMVALSAAMQLVAGVQAALAVIPALVSISSLAAFLPTALFSLVGAFIALKVATKGVGDALKAAFTGEGLQEALEKLTPSARKFVKAFAEMAPAFKGLGKIMQETLFEPLGARALPMLKSVFPVIAAGMTLVSKELGLLGAEVMDFFSGASGKNMLSAYLVGAADLLAGIRSGVKPLLEGLSAIAVTVGPLWKDFGKTIGSVMTQFGLWMEKISKNGQLLEWIDMAMETLQSLWAILRSIGQIIMAVAKAAGTAGGSFGGLAVYLGQIATWAKSIEGQKALSSFFGAIADIASKLAPLLTTVAGIIGNVLAPALAKIVIGLAPGVGVVLEAFGKALEALAPHMPPLAMAISHLLISLAPLLPIIGQIAGIIAENLAVAIEALASVLAPIIKTVLPIFNTMMAAFAQIMTERGPFINQIVATLVEMLDQFAPIGMEVARIFGEQFNVFLPQFIEIAQQMLPIILQLIRTFFNLYLAVAEQLMPHLPALIQAALTLTLAFAQLLPAMIPLIEAGLQLLNEVVIPNIGYFTALTVVAIELWAAYMEGVAVVVRFAARSLEALGMFWRWVTEHWRMLGGLLVQPWSQAWDAIRSKFIDPLMNAIGRVRDAVGGMVDAIKKIPGASFLPGLWTGGPAEAGQRYMVGELGPEIFVDMAGRTRMLGQYGPETTTFSQPGFVIPNHLTEAFVGLKDSMDRQHARLAARTREPAMAAVAGQKTEIRNEGDTHYHVDTHFHGGDGPIDPGTIERTIRKTIKAVEKERKERR